MKKIYNILLISLFLLVSVNCSRDLEGLELATYPNTGEVFIDAFTGDLQYAAFGGSDVKAFDVDNEVKYKGLASMKFAVPDVNDPNGAYAGGVFYSTTGRDLTGYTCLSFWAKASQPANIDVIGLGNDLGEAKYQASISAVPVNTNWKQYYIPLPDPSKLTMEKGMLFYSEGAENGRGYTFWIDEVKFENLGTIAHIKPLILGGQDKTIETYNGVTDIITDLGMTANLPNGVDQFVNLTPTYFTFESSNPGVASVDQTGKVTVLGQGTAVISAKIGKNAASGSLTIKSSGEFIQPPIPQWDAADVISVYSNTYTNVPVEYFNGYWEPYQTTLSNFMSIGGNDLISYTNFNFVGIQFTSPTINASKMTHIHMDLFTTEGISDNTAFSIQLLDAGNDGVIGNDDSSSTLPLPEKLQAGSWNSIDIPLRKFSSLAARAHLAQIIFEGNISSFIVDNIYFYDSGEIEGQPTEAAPTPIADPADVISIYSNAYTNVEGTDFFPNWGQITQTSQIDIAGNNTLLMLGLNYQGIQFGSSQNLSEMHFLHIDYCTINSSALNLYLISPGKESPYSLPVPTTGWASVDIPLSTFSSVVDLNDVIQFKFDGNGDVFVDNLYFYKSNVPTSPTTGAPAPTQDASNVLSIYSDAYSNIEGTDFFPNWGQSTGVSTVDIAGNNTLQYANFNYQGTQFGGAQDVSSMQFLHIDMWTANATVVQMSPISASSGEKLYSLAPINPGEWNSYDIPLTYFTDAGMTMADIHQFKFDGQAGTNPSDIWLDNIYFYKVASATSPTTGAPAPTQDASNVISIYSDAYTNIGGTDFFTNWGQSTGVSMVEIAGNNTLQYANFNYQGTQLGAAQDLSTMQFLHIDMWTANATVVQMSPISASSGEKLYSLSPINPGVWNSYDIPLSYFTDAGMTMADIHQFKFDGQAGTNPSDIWLDNIYFYKKAEGGYNNKVVTHLGIEAEVASKILLTIAKSGDKSLKITIESADSDPVDDLIVNNLTGPITGSPAVSDIDSSVAGKLSRTLSWNDNPPSEIELCILWSKASFPGNWQLSTSNIKISFN